MQHERFCYSFSENIALIAGFDAELREIVALSLGVGLSASALAFVIGWPVGTALAVYRFRGREALVVIANAPLGLPPVVVGLVVYLLLSRVGHEWMAQHHECSGARSCALGKQFYLC